MVGMSVINRLVGAIAELSTIVKIYKYRGLHEGHHFIPMAVEVHYALGHDMDYFIKECACLFHDKQSKDNLSLSFCTQFFKQHVNIVFRCALTFAIEKKIMLTRSACSRPPTTIRFHNLHVGNSKRDVGEIVSYIGGLLSFGVSLPSLLSSG
jgi:hypothetical protein